MTCTIVTARRLLNNLVPPLIIPKSGLALHGPVSR
jgi:hypothetical protein